MSLECLNNIILDNLAIHIDLSNSESWDLNTGLTSISLTKWKDAISSDLDLPDFGLTGYDNGFLDSMLSGFTLTANDNKFKLYRVGYNNSTGETTYSSINSVSGTSIGWYFNLNGGFLQGFYKLEKYEYEVLPPRYNNGITIETLIYISGGSEGIFFLMGTRAEDKYNSYFSGETGISGEIPYRNSTGGTNYQYHFSGITTSEENYLNAYLDKEIIVGSTSLPENIRIDVQEESSQIENLTNNIIAFELTSDKKFAYRYLDENGNLQYNTSPNVLSRTGWTFIDIVFTPDAPIKDYDPELYNCYPRRTGDLRFYVNSRLFWTVKDFTEWYSRPIINNKEKQLGVPFTISWGGGSFGLEHSWHFTSGYTSAPYVQDPTKADLMIEKYFNSTYIGSIQKLRVYTNALNSAEILHNILYEIETNSAYNIRVSKGGRIIYQ